MELKWFVKENVHLTRGAFGMDFGWGNGYVCLPPDHKAFGLEYDAVHDMYPELEVNGGLTFSASASKLTNWTDIPEDCKDCWIVGFDTCHSGDNIAIWPKSSVERETKKLAEQLS